MNTLRRRLAAAHFLSPSRRGESDGPVTADEGLVTLLAATPHEDCPHLLPGFPSVRSEYSARALGLSGSSEPEHVLAANSIAPPRPAEKQTAINERFNIMKTPHNKMAGRRASCAGASSTFTALLLAALPLAAADPTTISGTAYLVSVPVPGILCTNAAGQVSLKGNVHVLMVQTDDPRATGRFQAGMDMAYQADGTALFGGSAYQEVGTWDVDDPANPEFTPTGGVWDMIYRGVIQADGTVITLTGYGVGGDIDGLRLEETITKGPSEPFDPVVPYLGTGTILPALVTTTDVVGTFEATLPASWGRGAGLGTMSLIQANGQLTIRGNWPGIHTVIPHQTTAFVSPGRPWAVQQGQSLETRVDLISLDGAAPNAVLAIYHDAGIGYWMVKGPDFVVVGKENGDAFTYLIADRLTTQNENEVLVLALTPAGPNVILTARVLDKSNGEAVLYERSTVDTPASDPSLSSAQITAITGMTLQVQSDPGGAPWTSGVSPWLGVWQYTDGTLPAAEATFDNFELRTYEIPEVGIERAVQLTWPVPSGMNYAVEGAPTAQGPFLPVPEWSMPGMQTMTVPASEAARFFRLRQAP